MELVLFYTTLLSPVCTSLFTTIHCFVCVCAGFQYVTCASVLKLASAESNIRLHSHDVKYGSGSGQQVFWLLVVCHGLLVEVVLRYLLINYHNFSSIVGCMCVYTTLTCGCFHF